MRSAKFHRCTETHVVCLRYVVCVIVFPVYKLVQGKCQEANKERDAAMIQCTKLRQDSKGQVFILIKLHTAQKTRKFCHCLFTSFLLVGMFSIVLLIFDIIELLVNSCISYHCLPFSHVY